MLFIKTKVKNPLAWVTLNDSGYPCRPFGLLTFKKDLIYLALIFWLWP